jgi:osmotically-inducible protein OsmY
MKQVLASVMMLLALSGLVWGQAKKQSDDTIYDMVKMRLANDPDIKGGHLQVDVKAGVVTVQGRVDKEKARAKVDKVARKVKGVTTVNNQVRVEP